MRDPSIDRLFRAPWWLPGGHAQTIWPAKRSWVPNHYIQSIDRARWTTPDGDFIYVDSIHTSAHAQAPLLVLFHGLEGSSRSHYARAFAQQCQQSGWSMVVPHFRGCSGQINNAPRAYHSGDHQEIDWILKRLRTQYPNRTLYAVGVSLGGNALLRWAGEQGSAATKTVAALAAVCAPVDLAAAGHRIDHGIQRWLYARMFLKTMIRKAGMKSQQYPRLFDWQAVRSSRTLYEFDMHFTAPLHGFKDTDDYWAQASSKPVLSAVEVPSLVLNSLNDPFIPAESLPQPAEVGQSIQLWQPDNGGHVGFPEAQSQWPRARIMGMPCAVMQWLNQHH